MDRNGVLHNSNRDIAMQSAADVGHMNSNRNAREAEEERYPISAGLKGVSQVESGRDSAFISYSRPPDNGSREERMQNIMPVPYRNIDQNSSPISKQSARQSQADISSTTALVGSQSPVPKVRSKAPLVSQHSTASRDAAREIATTRQEPWEVVRWTKLKRISDQVFSETSTREFGFPTCLDVGAFIAIGTSKGAVILFDYQQSMKCVLGQKTLAVNCGPVLSLSISADHSTVAAGHSNGSIFTWDISQPTKPFLQIAPLNQTELSSRRSDGHLIDSAVLHVGFLGHRHTALVSADDRGMVFSHLASRGLGPLGRSVRTTRLLGRYPNSPKPQTPTSVLAFAPLPLGNIARITDEMGLTAILTPYLLIIISTTPSAQTHFKLRRAPEFESDYAMTGCIAWFPAMQIGESSAQGTVQSSTKAKLVYCWSNSLGLLDVEASNDSDKSEFEGGSELRFQSHSYWKSEEAILAVQWINRSLIAVLTMTQRLVILADNPIRVADSCDLNSKRIYHQDVFSRQLSRVFDDITYGDGPTRAVIPDAYHMSFKAYKGRLFLLGIDDISLGTLSNWADRLVSLMEAGKPIAAIELATSFYDGEMDTVSIGLPQDDQKRQTMVKGKILELLSASLQYLSNDKGNRRHEAAMRSTFSEVARVNFSAYVRIGESSFLFDEMYEKFSHSSVKDVFLYELEGYILGGEISVVPTEVLGDMLSLYESRNLRVRLGRILCALNTDTMDFDAVSTVCLRLGLFDAFISVWNRALRDYVTPLVHLMSLAQTQKYNDDLDPPETSREADVRSTLFRYLTYILTGRTYPEASEMTEEVSLEAKASMYSFIFAEKSMSLHHTLINSNPSNFTPVDELNYPYLRFLILLDCSCFMSMLNEAFEDSFLNGDQPPDTLNRRKIAELLSGTPINRQRIVNILLEVMGGAFGTEEHIYLDIFLARNVPKFSQFILLSVSFLRQILIELCQNPPAALHEECQLSVEYLLSTYHPPDLLEFVPLFSKARYFRILRSTFRSTRKYAKLIETHLEDPGDKMLVFDSIAECLRPGSGLTKRQTQEVKSVITENINALASLDVGRTASYLQSYAPDMLEEALRLLNQGSEVEFLFLQSILEPSAQGQKNIQIPVQSFYETHISSYLILMCKHNVQHVAEYVSSVEQEYLDLDTVLPHIDAAGAVEAAVLVLTRKGFAREAMRKLLEELKGLQRRTTEHQTATEMSTENIEAVSMDEEMLDNVRKYANIGIWLCQHAMDNSRSLEHNVEYPQDEQSRKELGSSLTPVEQLWLNLIDSVILISQAVLVEGSYAITPSQSADALRQVVQKLFTRLLAATSQSPFEISASSSIQSKQAHDSPQPAAVRFLYVLTAFISRIANRSTSISSVRTLLSTIFATYTFESSMLAMANTLLEKDTFVHVSEAEKRRRFGWRPRTQLCERCKRRAWGASAGVAAWEAWRQRKLVETRKAAHFSSRYLNDSEYASEQNDSQKGKGKDDYGASNLLNPKEVAMKEDSAAVIDNGVLVFSCSHVFHLACFEKTLSDPARSGYYRCPLCS